MPKVEIHSALPLGSPESEWTPAGMGYLNKKGQEGVDLQAVAMHLSFLHANQSLV